MRRFGTDQKCLDFLIKVRWNGRPQCPKCGNDEMNYYLSTRNIYKCSKCYKQFSVTQGTIFERSKIPLTKWFMAIYVFTTKKRGVSSYQMAEWIGVRQPTAWFMMHRLREALKEENNIVLSGIVEADETFVGPKVNRDLRLRIAKQKHDKEQDRLHGYGKRKKRKIEGERKRGRKKGTTKEVVQQMALERGGKPYRSNISYRVPFEKGTVVFGITERGGKVVLKKLGINNKSVTIGNIFPLLKKHISPTSTFITDQLNLYNGTSEFFAEHLTVNHEKGYVIDGVHSNCIENVWKFLKKTLESSYFHISHHHFDGYLDEFTYRWNRRKQSKISLFESFIPLIAGKTLSYKKLITKNQAQQAA